MRIPLSISFEAGFDPTVDPMLENYVAHIAGFPYVQSIWRQDLMVDGLRGTAFVVLIDIDFRPNVESLFFDLLERTIGVFTDAADQFVPMMTRVLSLPIDPLTLMGHRQVR